jgi:predicted nucleotidyltransferase
MNNFDVASRTILLVRHGSHAYGLSTPTSDEDFKGVCIKPKEAYFGFTQKFEQHEHMGSKSDGIDKVVYSLDKFASLAADCNPNIVEVLHVDPSDIIKINSFGEELREHRFEFLSKKAKFTFSGYAHAQLKRIKTHRAWLLNPPKAAPTRKEFGLSETHKVSASELGAMNAMFQSEQAMIESGLGREVITLFVHENAYNQAKMHYDQYLNWVKTRNPKRAELEAKYGYDTKHGMHLLRLMKMCREILTVGTVNVKRTEDREELMGVRNGDVPYDDLIERAEQLEAQCEALYGLSQLPREPNRAAIDKLVVDMTDRYLRLHG